MELYELKFKLSQDEVDMKDKIGKFCFETASTISNKLLLIIVSEWLLLNVNLAIFQLYYGENKLIFNEIIIRSALNKKNIVCYFSSKHSVKEKEQIRVGPESG
jgi:hypothetical protein